MAIVASIILKMLGYRSLYCKDKYMKLLILFVLSSVLILGETIHAVANDDFSFVGSRVCSQCHESQYKYFKEYSKKAHAWDSIEIMKPKLKESELRQCYDCHTTGHGKKGGFTSKEATPDLADVGCETCHGPGSAHAESGERKLITRRPSTHICASCHSSQRIQDFKFKPLIYSGAH